MLYDLSSIILAQIKQTNKQTNIIKILESQKNYFKYKILFEKIKKKSYILLNF